MLSRVKLWIVNCIFNIKGKHFAFAYFSMIPFFAIIYYFLPGNSFYEPYIHKDPSIVAEAQADSRWLGKLLDSQLKNIKQDQNEWSATQIIPFALQPSNNSNLYLTAQVVFESKVHAIPKLGIAEIRLIQNGASEGIGSNPEPIMFWQLNFEDSSTMPVNLNKLFSCTRYLPDQYYTFPCIAMSKEQSDRLTRLWLAEQGWPSSAPGQIGRLLYLSAITITTVGYGDIVPMTWWARIATASEAVIGIILIGLFINSAMKGIGKQSG